MDYILLIILSFSVGAFAIQLAYASTLSDSIKRILGLEQPYKLRKLQYISNWKKIIQNKFVFYCLFPILILFIIVIALHKLISGMVNCAYCSSFWLMLIVNISIMGLELPLSIALAPLSLVSVAIIEKIMS